MTSLKNENISFLIDENDENDNEENNNQENDNEENEEFIISNILNEEYENEDELDLTHFVINYQINYTVKQLLQICEYYNISKNIKLIKANKDEIITNIVLFETNSENYEIVIKRKQMWYYIEELKNDRFMKKFILLWK